MFDVLARVVRHVPRWHAGDEREFIGAAAPGDFPFVSSTSDIADAGPQLLAAPVVVGCCAAAIGIGQPAQTLHSSGSIPDPREFGGLFFCVSSGGVLRLVPGGEVESPRYCYRRILSPLRLPVPPSRPGMRGALLQRVAHWRQRRHYPGNPRRRPERRAIRFSGPRKPDRQLITRVIDPPIGSNLTPRLPQPR